jgi:hypothetical protein
MSAQHRTEVKHRVRYWLAALSHHCVVPADIQHEQTHLFLLALDLAQNLKQTHDGDGTPSAAVTRKRDGVEMHGWLVTGAPQLDSKKGEECS